jgi:myo-inositol-1(or 4)-monophosphatase
MLWQKEKDAAERAAREAGKVVKNFSLSEIRSSEGRDVKHEADLVSERIILQILSESCPEYSILAEESGEHGDLKEGGPKWVVDPLDGTLNFSKGIEFSCISIALWTNHPVLGVVYDFNREEIFSGIVGQGATCNATPIKCSTVDSTQKAVLATGFPVNRDFSSKALKNFLGDIKRFKKIRLLGSAALSLAYVACGRMDAYSEENIMFWDVAAGIALVRAAGGFVEFESVTSNLWKKDVKAGESFKNHK